jgi:hypothetical protein
MTKKDYYILITVGLVLIFGISSCGEVKKRRKNLKRLRYNKEWIMRENWQDYIVYKRWRPDDSFQRGAAAFLYKLKDDKVILMDNRWFLVTSEEVKAGTKIMESVWSAEIRGYNEELYGYLIYRGGDRPSVRIIDEKTVRLSYQYTQDYSN